MITATSTGATHYATPTDREILMTRVFDAPRRLVWAAFTTPEHLKRWMLGPPGWTMTVCDIDLRVGGRWRFEWSNVNGTAMTLTGEYREVVDGERIVQTESWGEQWAETLNTLTLEEHDGRTTVTNRVLYPSTATRDAALNSGMKQGNALSYERLDAVLRTIA